MYSNDGDRLPTENDDVPLNGNICDRDAGTDISLKEIKRATFHQKNNSSYGLYNVCLEANKSSFDLILDHLLNVVNHIFNTRDIQNRGVMA